MTRTSHAAFFSVVNCDVLFGSRPTKALRKNSTTEAYRVRFPGGDPNIELAGIIDRPQPTEDADEAVPIVVFSHCFTCNKDLKATVRISRALARSGIAVLRFDMTGLGGSRGDFSETNFTTNLADLAAAIRFADQELGPVTGLIGHSFGGIASLTTAGLYKIHGGEEHLPLRDLGAVITLAAPSDTQHLAVLLDRMNPKIETTGSGEVSIGGIRWTIRKQMLDDFREHDVTAIIPHVPCPVMLMHSPIDETVGIDHALRIMGLINSAPDAANRVSVVSLDEADHLLVRDPRDLEYVAETMSAFLHRYASP